MYLAEYFASSDLIHDFFTRIQNFINFLTIRIHAAPYPEH